MHLENYITDLIRRHECVTVPGLGAFLSRRIPARLDLEEGIIYPPSKIISFNAQLDTHDGLLVNHVAKSLSLNYDMAKAQVDSQVSLWKSKLQTGPLLLGDLGSFQFSREGKLQYEPNLRINFLMESFGLSTAKAIVLYQKKEPIGVEELPEALPPSPIPNKHARRKIWSYAAAAVIALAVSGLSVRIYYKEKASLERAELQKAQEIIEQKVQEASFDLGTLSSLQLPIINEPLSYHIIAGAFRVEANAIFLRDKLRAQGYESEKMEPNKFGLHPVTYGSYATEEEALEHMRMIRRQSNTDAWLMIESNP